MDLSFYMLGCLCYTLGMGEEFDSGTILSCLRRYVARRGKPQLIISDNAPQGKNSSRQAMQ